jgi:hypothetical protein
MDQPHNQYLIKELIFSDVKYNGNNYINSWGGTILKINLYSTGNIDLFKKEDISYSSSGTPPLSLRIDYLINYFYTTKEYIFQDTFCCQYPQIMDIRNYLDKITFIPTEHILSFSFNKTLPLDDEVLSFIEYIVNHNKGKIEEVDLEPIHYILQSQKENEYLTKVVHFNQLITNLIIIICFVFIFILNLKNKYK